MLRPPRNGIRRQLTHRLLAGLALLAYCAATFGFPLPPRNPKDTSQPFPCQDHLCGCQSAEQCWRGCCCLSAAERWAWAREHHVEPPSYAEPPEADGWRTQPLREEEDGTAASAQKHDCCQNKAPVEQPRCEGGACCHDKPAANDSPAGLHWTLGIAVQHCNPVKALWIASGAVLLLPARPVWNPWLAPGEWLSFADHIAANLSSAPLDPPPRTTVL
jgi:hypothetical protein